MSHRLSNPFASIMEARKWASNSLPRLIVFAIGLHMFFSFVLMTELHEHHEQMKHLIVLHDVYDPYDNRDSARPRLYPSQTVMRITPPVATLPMINTKERALEVDDLYIQQLININEELKNKLNVTHAVSCRWRPNFHSIFEENCSAHRLHGRIAIFNPLEQARILCDGTRIGPASIRVLNHIDLSCSEPPHLFPTVPTLETKDKMDPIGLRFRLRGDLPKSPCDVPCKGDEPTGVVAKRLVEGTPFVIDFSMEGPQYYNALRINLRAHRHNYFYSTTSFNSEIPLPYFSFDEYGSKIQGKAVDYSEAIKGGVFIARNCQSRNNREALVQSLINSNFRVDSVSKCLHNAEVSGGVTEKKDIMSRYLFYLAFENQCENDYITEKLWQTLESGTVPIYYGAPNIEDHVPPNSIINANAFNTTEALANYLTTLVNNQTLYESYHAWRSKPLPESFLRKYNMTRTHSTCRTCRWAAAKKYGLGWNATSQTIEDLLIPRKLCRDSENVLTHPFREAWLSGNGKRSILIQSKEQQTCETQETTFSTPIFFGKHDLRRTIRSQDGVVDVYLEGSQQSHPTSEGLILQMNTTIDGRADSESLRTLSLRHYRFQDATKRMTILSSRNVDVRVNDTGVLELYIAQVHMATKLRFIVEDIEQYPDSAQRTNYFGQLMTEDFLNPIEKFLVRGNPQNESDWIGKTMNSLGIISAEGEEDDVDTDDIVRRDMERKERIREEAEAIRKSLIQVKDAVKEASEKKALSGIKKLIELGIIKIAADDDEK